MPRFSLTPAEIKRLEQGDELSRFVHALLNEWDRNGLHGISASATLRNGRPYHLVPETQIPATYPAAVPANGAMIAGVPTHAKPAAGESIDVV